MNKTCLLDAAVHTCCLEIWKNPDYSKWAFYEAAKAVREDLIEEIGHDGSDHGFHTQEIADALRARCEILVVPHEAYPGMQIMKEGKPFVIPIYKTEEIEGRFLPRLNRNNGILVVDYGKVHHALSFQKGSNTAYDVHKDLFIPLEQLIPIRFLEFVDANN